MTALEELLIAAERLAEAVADFKEIDRRAPPLRSEFGEGEEGEDEFREAVQSDLEDQEATRAALTRALRDYRWAEQRELSARAIRGNGTARRPAQNAVPSPPGSMES